MSDLPLRAAIPVEETWDLSPIYATVNSWKADASRLEADAAHLAAFRARLAEGSSTLLQCLQTRQTMLRRLFQLLSYADLHMAADGISSECQSLSGRAAALAAAVESAQSWIAGALTALPDGEIARYRLEEPALEEHHHLLDDALRRRAHLLAPGTEQALAALGEALNAPYGVFQSATAVDMVCPSVTDAQGHEHPVSISRYVFGLSQDHDRDLRRRAYDALTTGLQGHQATLATSLATHIRRNVVQARLRHYPSAVDMLLDAQNVPRSVYENITQAVPEQLLPHMRRLFALRRRVLGIEQLHLYDLQVPLAPASGPAVTFAEAERLIREALSPLDSEYDMMLAAAFRDRWIDRAANAGKSSGAFCNPVYGVHPFILTTWQDSMLGAFVLAHELGHAGHMHMADRSRSFGNAVTYESLQPLLLFVEAPSTANELLLGYHLLSNSDDRGLRSWVASQLISTFIANAVNGLIGASFERRLYELAEADVPLTLSTLLEVQGEEYARAYGEDIEVDDGARLSWARTPHFYMDLYLYTYSAGLICACAVVDSIRTEGRPAAERWLMTLEAGSSLSAVELMRRSGVDLSSAEPVRRLATSFGALIEELERGLPQSDSEKR